jgi:Uma2 family endonuclease
MVQTPIKTITLEAFLAMPETQPASEFIDGVLPLPEFAMDLRLTIGELFDWLSE